MMFSNSWKKILCITAIAFVIILSATFVSDAVMSPSFYPKTISYLDSSIENVKTLSTTTVMLSVGLSALKDDTATPIAEELAECSVYFFAILSLLYVEKFSLTIIGCIVFRILIPVAGLIVIAGICFKNMRIHRLALWIVVFCLLIFFLVPVSVKISGLIQDTYDFSIEQTVSDSVELTDVTEAAAEAQGDRPLIDRILSYFDETISSLSKKASDQLYKIEESIAVMFVTSCIIPILVFFCFCIVLKKFFGISVPAGGFGILRHKAKDTILRAGRSLSGTRDDSLPESGPDDV